MLVRDGAADGEATGRRQGSFGEAVRLAMAKGDTKTGVRNSDEKPTRPDTAETPQSKVFSSGGLDAPDGNTRDPFPPSLVAYIEVLRSVAAYLRGEFGAGGTNPSAAGLTAETTVAAVAEEIDIAEPTTFAVGEEEHDACPTDRPDLTTLAIGEEDGGAASVATDTQIGGETFDPFRPARSG